jgi:hypothetical protein
MKKMILTLAIAVSTLSAFAKEEKVAPLVLNAFNKEFTTAKEVEWTIGSNFYIAAFVYNEKHVFAYYNAEGHLLGLTQYISPDTLPMTLQSSLKKDYGEYWISDLFEVAKDGTTAYYITMENAEKKVVLQAIGGDGWSVYKKIRKA